MKQIIVEIKDVYGHDKCYPLCTDAKLFANIAATTTLTKNSIDIIKKAAYSGFFYALSRYSAVRIS